MKPGTPAGMQLDRAVKAILPASTSAMSLRMCSFTHGLRLGLVRSAIRNVGCPAVPLGTKGCAGSPAIGGSCPGTAAKFGPPPLRPIQPVWFEEKSGTLFCCAVAGATAAQASTARMADAMVVRAVNGDIVAAPFGILAPAGHSRAGEAGARNQ